MTYQSSAWDCCNRHILECMVPDQPRFFPTRTPSGVKVTVEPNLGSRLADLPPLQLGEVPSHPDRVLRDIFNERRRLGANSPEDGTPILRGLLDLDLRGPVGMIKYMSFDRATVIAISMTRRKLGFIAQNSRTLLWLEISNIRSGRLFEGLVREYPRYCFPRDIPSLRQGSPRRLAMFFKKRRALVSTEPPAYEPNRDPKHRTEQHRLGSPTGQVAVAPDSLQAP